MHQNANAGENDLCFTCTNSAYFLMHVKQYLYLSEKVH